MSTSKLNPFNPTEEQLSALWDQSIGRHPDQWIGHALQVADAANAHYESQLRATRDAGDPQVRAAQPAGDAKRVFLVATGEAHEGMDTYTRHEGEPPRLCDSECLYAAPQPAGDAAMPSGVPLGAIENGRTYADRLEHDYKFECEAGSLPYCDTWRELRRCFEALADWCAGKSDAQAALAAKDAEIDRLRALGAKYLDQRMRRDASIAHLEADLVEERNRIADMRVEWAAEVAALTAQARHAEDCLEAAKARIAALESEMSVRRADWVATAKEHIAELEAAIDGGVLPAAEPVESFHIASVTYAPTPGSLQLDAPEPNIDAAALAPASETFMHAATEPDDPAQEDCLYCDGSGEREVYYDSQDPGSHKTTICCEHCGGTGALADAYRRVLTMFKAKNDEYLQLATKLYVADHAKRDTEALLAEHMRYVQGLVSEAHARGLWRGKTPEQKLFERETMEALERVEASARKLLGLAS